MKIHRILLVLLLLAPIFSAYWYYYRDYSGTYSIEKPWTYQTWRCNNSCDVYGVIICEKKSVRITDWPYRYYVSCDCDDDGCSSCPMCGHTTRTYSLSSLGYVNGAWDITKFENALDSLELDIFNGESNSSFSYDYENYSTVLNNLEDAYEYRQDASEYAETCRDSGSYSAHTKIVNHGYMCAVDMDITFSDYRAVMASGGVREPYPCSSSEPSNPAGAYCKSYYVYWENTVARAFSALSFSFSYANNKIESQARPLWNRMEESGVCDDDYDWDIGNACDDAESAFNTLDSGRKEGTYGQYNSAKAYLEGLREGVWNYPPDLSNYSKAMKFLWQEGGAIPLFTRLMEDCDSAMEEAENIYQAFMDEAGSYKSTADSKYSEMESEKISMIHETVAVEQIKEESIGTIAERFSTFRDSRSEAEDAFSNATYLHSRTSEDAYLKKATRNAYNARNLYDELSGDADLLLDDAETVVEQQRERTLTVLNQAKTVVDRNLGDSSVSYIYNQAQNLFNRGESAATLGEKFDYYARAESYAWQLLEEQHMVTTETEELLLQVEDLLRRAEIDGINVASEQAMLDSVADDSGSRDISPELRAIMASVLEKADIKYGYLLDVRSELLTNISRSEGCGDDLGRTLENAENGIISGSSIDYMNGIGRLKTLDSDYQDISEELSICENSIIANSLIISQSLNIGKVKIDEPVNAKLLVLISNPTYYSGEGVVVHVPMQADIPLLYSDITEGRETVSSVIVQGNDLMLTLDEVKPYWTRSIRFEKDAVFASTVNVDRTAEGIGDGKVRVEEARTFRLDADDVYLELPSGEVMNAEIDGRSADSMLDSGEHTLSVVYVTDDAYTLERSEIEAADVGLNARLSYKVSILPSMDIDTLPIVLDMEYGNVSGISISSVSGASITREECEIGYCNVELSGLEEDEETLISVSYMILNTDSTDASVPYIPESGYCIEGIDKKCDELPSEINNTISMINSASESGDYATAIELREKLKDDINRWLKEQQSLADDYMELLAALENEKAELGSALGIAGTANGSLIDDLEKRKSDVEDALDSAENSGTLRGAVNALQAVGLEWKQNTIKQFQDDSWNTYNEFKQRLFNAGVTSMPSEFMEVENSINALSSSGGLADAVKLMLALDSAESVVLDAESDAAEEEEGLEIVFLNTKENITSLLEVYRNQQDAAEGTPWESIFTFDSAGMEKRIDGIEDMFGKEDVRLIRKKMEILDNKREKVAGILEQLKDESELMMETVMNSLETKRDSLPSDVVSTIESGLESMAGFISSGNYIGALKAGKVMLGELDSYSNEDGGVNLLLVAAAVLAVLAAAGVYYYKYKKGGNEGSPGMELPELPGLKTKKKEYRKLEKAEQ